MDSSFRILRDLYNELFHLTCTVSYLHRVGIRLLLLCWASLEWNSWNLIIWMISRPYLHVSLCHARQISRKWADVDGRPITATKTPEQPHRPRNCYVSLDFAKYFLFGSYLSLAFTWRCVHGIIVSRTNILLHWIKLIYCTHAPSMRLFP